MELLHLLMEPLLLHTITLVVILAVEIQVLIIQDQILTEVQDQEILVVIQNLLGEVLVLMRKVVEVILTEEEDLREVVSYFFVVFGRLSGYRIEC